MTESATSRRRSPRQNRSRFTRDIIFEATAQILEEHGEAALTTNRIAERAGISVGTIYQYFANKKAILVEMARIESARIEQLTAKLRADGVGRSEATRLAIRSYIRIFADWPATRKAALKAVLECEPEQIIGGKTDRTSYHLPSPPPASRIDAFVLTRAITGIVRAAVLEDFSSLLKPEFEDALVRLVENFRMHPASS